MSTKVSRREILFGAALVSLVAGKGPPKTDKRRELPTADLLQVNDLDRRIWQYELEEFVPSRLYDMHTHLSRAEFNLDPKSRYAAQIWTDPSATFDQHGSLELLSSVEKLLSPGRTVEHLLMPDPYEKFDFAGANEFIALQAKKKPGTRALMVVHPKMTALDIEKSVTKHRFVGFKPYLWYATVKDLWEAHISDFMPERQLAVANRYGLIVGLHLSKKRGIADPENLDDLERLIDKYPRVKWILYHNARSYSAWAIEEAAQRLHRLPNIWIETSSVCESAAFDASFSIIPKDRLMYGSDDFSVGITRGKYVPWGYGWAQMDRKNQTFQVDHCDGRLTFVRYEMLRAMRRAAKNQRFTKQEIEDLFYNNGERLIVSAWKDLNDALESNA
ncbi:MAG: amidohydrolase family protein [Acidobacteriota bacterium]